MINKIDNKKTSGIECGVSNNSGRVSSWLRGRE